MVLFYNWLAKFPKMEQQALVRWHRPVSAGVPLALSARSGPEEAQTRVCLTSARMFSE